jgi:hypothetical protein
MEPLGSRIGQFVPQLLPLFLQLSKDESDEVRNNAIFGIGEMVLHGKDSLFPYPFAQCVKMSVTANWVAVCLTPASSRIFLEDKH